MAKKTKYFPKTISLLGREFQVIFTDEELQVNEKPAAAFVDFDKMEIQIRNDLSPHNKLVALCHEVAHVGLDVAGLDQVFSDEVVESLCQTMANTYLDFMKSVGAVNVGK